MSSMKKFNERVFHACVGNSGRWRRYGVDAVSAWMKKYL